MTRSSVAAGAAAMTIVAAAALHVHGQSAAPKLTPEQVAAELRKPTKGFVQSKTAWGEPDISGVWTSDAALGIPRERDAKYAGRPFLTDEEYNNAHKADEQRRVAGENAIGAFRNDGAWKTKSYRQTSLVIEPEDGRTPAFTEEAQKRAAPRDRGSFGEGPFDSPLDFTLYDRCITRGIVGSVMPVVYGNGNRIIQAPGEVILSYEMVHEDPPVPRRLTRPLGWQHARHRDDQLHRPDEHRRRERQRTAPQRRPEDQRAHHARRQGRAPVRSARRRPEDVHEAVHHLAASDVTAWLRAAPVRVP